MNGCGACRISASKIHLSLASSSKKPATRAKLIVTMRDFRLPKLVTSERLRVAATMAGIPRGTFESKRSRPRGVRQASNCEC